MSSAASNEPVLLRRDENRVAVLTLNRPHAMNALSGDLIDALQAEFDRLAEDKEIRCVVKCVPVCVEKTVMQKHTVCKPVMHTVKKCVDKGCYETVCVEVKPSCFAGLFSKKDDCCNPCPPCPKYKTKKVWKPCIVVEEKQVCKMEKFTECRPVTVKCTEMKKVEEKIEVEVCSYECVAKTRVGVIGSVRIRLPVAAYTALATAAPTVPIVGSPAPQAGSRGRSIRMISIGGTSLKRIGVYCGSGLNAFDSHTVVVMRSAV